MTLRWSIGVLTLLMFVWLSPAGAAPTSLTVTNDPVVNRTVVEKLEIALREIDLQSLDTAPTVEQGAGLRLQAMKGSAQPNQQVTILIDDKPYGTSVEADSTGWWTSYLDTRSLSAGMHRLSFTTPTNGQTFLMDIKVIATAPQPASTDQAVPPSGSLPVVVWWLIGLVGLAIIGVATSLFHKHLK